MKNKKPQILKPIQSEKEIECYYKMTLNGYFVAKKPLNQ
jgi:hypothetical protein